MKSKYYAVDFKDNKFGIYDESDGVLEYIPISVVKTFLKRGVAVNGIVLDEETNPRFTINGLKVNLAYQCSKKFGKWVVVLLKAGDRFGKTLSSVIKDDTVAFYDSSVKWDKVVYPFGQYVASYKKDTILSHYGSLWLDTSVESWIVSEDEIDEINDWLISMM